MTTTFAVALIGVIMQIAASAQPPPLLQVVREPLKPGAEAAFAVIEKERARLSATLKCPHPYLGAETVSGPKEVWWVIGYQSLTEGQLVYDAYAKSAPLMAAFEKSAKPKADLTLKPTEVLASYRPDRSEGTPWTLGTVSRDHENRQRDQTGRNGLFGCRRYQPRRSAGRDPRGSGGDEGLRGAGHYRPRYPPIMELSGGRMDCGGSGILAS